MTENEFFNAIRDNSLHGAYCLYGREPYSRSRAVAACRAARAEAARELNVQPLRSPAFSDLVNACETLPFFDERRLVIAYDVSGDTLSSLADYVEKVPESCILLLDRDDPIKQSGMFQTLKILGRTVEFAPYDEDKAVAFLEKRARENGVRLERPAARRLVALLGTGLAALENALLRTADYVGRDNPLDVRAVDRCVEPEREVAVYAILDPLVAGNKKGALSALLTMLADGESAMGLSSYLLGASKKLLTAKQLLAQRRTEKEIAQALGGSPYAAQKTVQKAKRCDEGKLLYAVERFAAVQIDQVAGRARGEDARVLAVLECF